MGGEESGPADEYEALRARLLTALRRQPGDTRVVLRLAGELCRMEVAQKRMSPRKREELVENYMAALNSVRDQLFPEGR